MKTEQQAQAPELWNVKPVAPVLEASCISVARRAGLAAAVAVGLKK